jgi:hypothetical protein
MFFAYIIHNHEVPSSILGPATINMAVFLVAEPPFFDELHLAVFFEICI